MRKWGDSFLLRFTGRMCGPPRRLSLCCVATKLLHGRRRWKRLRLAFGRPGRWRLDTSQVMVMMMVNTLQLIHRTGRDKWTNLPDWRRSVRSSSEIGVFQNLFLIGVERPRCWWWAETGRRTERMIHSAFGCQQTQFRHFIHRSGRRRTGHPVISIDCRYTTASTHQIVVDGWRRRCCWWTRMSHGRTDGRSQLQRRRRR